MQVTVSLCDHKITHAHHGSMNKICFKFISVEKIACVALVMDLQKKKTINERHKLSQWKLIKNSGGIWLRFCTLHPLHYISMLTQINFDV